MSEYNATVVAVDSGIECFDKIKDSSSQYHKVVCYDLAQLEGSIAQKIGYIERRIADIYDQLSSMSDTSEDESNSNTNASQIRSLQEEAARLQTKLAALEGLQTRCQAVSSRYRAESQGILNTIGINAAEATHSMSVYLRKIQSIEGLAGEAGTTGGCFTNPFSGEGNYAVVIVDSAKYPETAEHINTAIHCGAPASLTLDRSGANENRRESLQGVLVRQGYDRDEYPMACFSEGGSGADVFYLSPSDNRGAGSSISHQLRNIPDGTTVRFRII